jgi:hypothetical protein
MPGPVSVTPRWSCRFRAAGPINPASLGRELDRVVDQIGDRLDQQIPVATHIEILVNVNAQGDILVLGDRFINVADFAQHFMQRDAAETAERRLFSISARRNRAVMIVND